MTPEEEFLKSDFDQCFTQMRHYDNQIFAILKFMFTGYTALIGVAVGIYQFGIKENIDFTTPLTLCLAVGLLIGLLLFALVIRNRVYYIHVTRYINEQRSVFLEKKPLGFQNQSRMYTNFKQPPFFNWRSSQSWYMYLSAFLNSILLGIFLYIIFDNNVCKWEYVISGVIILLAMQLVSAILYLVSRENKSASKSVFGSE
jgi:high-affinity Fe2+/Pb2+ permease